MWMSEMMFPKTKQGLVSALSAARADGRKQINSTWPSNLITTHCTAALWRPPASPDDAQGNACGQPQVTAGSNSQLLDLKRATAGHSSRQAQNRTLQHTFWRSRVPIDLMMENSSTLCMRLTLSSWDQYKQRMHKWSNHKQCLMQSWPPVAMKETAVAYLVGLQVSRQQLVIVLQIVNRVSTETFKCLCLRNRMKQSHTA